MPPPLGPAHSPPLPSFLPVFLPRTAGLGWGGWVGGGFCSAGSLGPQILSSTPRVPCSPQHLESCSCILDGEGPSSGSLAGAPSLHHDCVTALRVYSSSPNLLQVWTAEPWWLLEKGLSPLRGAKGRTSILMDGSGPLHVIRETRKTGSSSIPHH